MENCSNCSNNRRGNTRSNDRYPSCQLSPRRADTLEDYPLAMAYVPWQHFSTVYEPDRALMAGTIFPELDKPFLGRKGCRR